MIGEKMNYVMSDLHGCYDEFLQMLGQIDFTASDNMVIIGDAVDRGTGSVKLLKNLITRKNIRLLMGNHEWFMSDTIKRLPIDINFETIHEYIDDTVEITRENLNEYRTEHSYRNWTYNGGESTFHEYLGLSLQERAEVIKFLSGLSYYCELTVENQKYLLVHTIPMGFEKEKPLENYKPLDLLFNPHIKKDEWNGRFYDDKIMIVGHTPTLSISDEYAGKILKKKELSILIAAAPAKTMKEKNWAV